MRADQIAFYALDDVQIEQIKAQLGLANSQWIKDTVTANSNVAVAEQGSMENIAELQFNYDLGIELEILRYISGPHWHLGNPLFNPTPLGDRIWTTPPFISHVGIHLDDGEEFPAMEQCKLVQETFTISHTAPYLTTGPAAGRKYHYRIFEMSPGSYIKYIKRLHPEK